MELKEFISSTLEQISRGVLEAGANLQDTNAIVSPHDFRINSENSQAFGRTRKEAGSDADEGTRVVQKVDFDIAVTVDETDKANAGARISVLSIGLGVGGETTTRSGTVSRINFSVPVVFPSHET